MVPWCQGNSFCKHTALHVKYVLVVECVLHANLLNESGLKPTQ